MQKTEILHYPILDTVLMVEKTLNDEGHINSVSALMRKLPKQVMRPTINLILNYLEEKGHILRGSKGITWVHNDSKKVKNLLASTVEI